MVAHSSEVIKKNQKYEMFRFGMKIEFWVLFREKRTYWAHLGQNEPNEPMSYRIVWFCMVVHSSEVDQGKPKV